MNLNFSKNTLLAGLCEKDYWYRVGCHGARHWCQCSD